MAGGYTAIGCRKERGLKNSEQASGDDCRFGIERECCMGMDIDVVWMAVKGCQENHVDGGGGLAIVKIHISELKTSMDEITLAV